MANFVFTTLLINARIIRVHHNYSTYTTKCNYEILIYFHGIRYAGTGRFV